MDVIEFVSDYPGLDDPDIATYKAEFEQRIDIEYAIKYLLTLFGSWCLLTLLEKTLC